MARKEEEARYEGKQRCETGARRADPDGVAWLLAPEGGRAIARESEPSQEERARGESEQEGSEPLRGERSRSRVRESESVRATQPFG